MTDVINTSQMISPVRNAGVSPIRGGTATTAGSYAQQHLKQAADRNAYMSFLEV